MTSLTSGVTFICIVLCAIFMATNASVNTAKYEAGPSVKGFALMDIKTIKSDATAYITKLMYHCGPVLAVGVLATIIFLIWSCYLQCCCKPMPSNRTLKVAAIVLIIFFFTLIGLLAWGLVVEKDQSAFISEIKDTVTFLADIVLVLGNVTSNLATAGNAIEQNVNVLLLNASGYNLAVLDLNGINSSTTSFVTQTSSINSTVSGFSGTVTSLKNEVFKQLDFGDSYRKLVMLCLIIVPIGLITIQIIFGLLNAKWRFYRNNHVGARASIDFGEHKAPRDLPRFIKCCLSPLLTVLTILVLLLLWLLAFLFFAIGTILADVCLRPTEDIASVASLSADLSFYLNCTIPNSYPPSINSTVTTLKNNFDLKNVLVDQLVGNLTVIGVNCTSTCSDAILAINATNAQISALKDQLLGFVECAGLQSRFNAVLNLMCSSLFMNIYNAFFVFIAIAFVITLAEGLRRIIPTPSINDDPVNYDEVALSQMLAVNTSTSDDKQKNSFKNPVAETAMYAS